jgi:hypothetical protein
MVETIVREYQGHQEARQSGEEMRQQIREANERAMQLTRPPVLIDIVPAAQAKP